MSLTERFIEALTYSLELNSDKYRKGNQTPYVAHLLAVAAIVLEYGGDEDQTIAALLHESAENAGGVRTLIEIRNRFGERVAKIVRSCADAVLNIGQEKPDWKLRKLEFVASLKGKPADAILVCLADKLHNSRSLLCDLKIMGDAAWERYNGDKEGTLWYYRAMIDAFKTAPTVSPSQFGMVKEFEGIVAEIGNIL